MSKRYLSIVGIVVVVLFGVILFSNKKPSSNLNGSFSSSDILNLFEAKPTETVVLKNGDAYDLTASYVKKNINGTEFRMLAYNSSIPGPLIRVKQGSEVTINFTNNTDVDSTIHSHGVRVENAFDGVPDLTQQPVKPGESFTYKLKFPDAGIYWYHPHIREDYAQEFGLYGNFLVEPGDPSYWNPVNREVTLFLDDVLMENGQIARFDPKTANHTLMGRFGNIMLVNYASECRG